MKAEEVLTTKEVRMRITALEYKYNQTSNQMSEAEFKEEIERIYLEEMGKQLKVDMYVLKSSDSKELKDDDSGYDGTAIHFSSKQHNIDEVYIVSQGSQDLADVSYNIKGLFAGQSIDQAEATQRFAVDALEEFGIEVNKHKMSEVAIPVVGLSHSLANNNNATATLLHDTFSSVHSVNGAQTNYYQLFYNDPAFNLKLKKEYPELKQLEDKIYELDPDKIKTTAEDFYAEKGKHIHQDISKNDPLYAVSGERGFFKVGQVEYHVTNDKYGGLRELFDKIPDEVTSSLQEVAINYAVAIQSGDIDTMLMELTGVDMKVIKKIDGKWDAVKGYFSEDLTNMLPHINEKLPTLLDNIMHITENSETIFSELREAEYISNSQKKELIGVFNGIEKELLIIQDTLISLETSRNNDYVNPLGTLGYEGGLAYTLFKSGKKLEELFSKLDSEGYRLILDMIIESHGINEMLDSLGKKKISYLNNGDMLMAPSKRSGGGEDIWINISAALRMYEEGRSVLEERTEQINRLEQTIERVITEHFETEKKKILIKIDDIEQNSSKYLLMVQSYSDAVIKKVERINVHDQINPLPNVNHDEEIKMLKQSVTEGLKFVKQTRTAVEDMFDEEAKVAKLFEVVEGMINAN